jgi:rhamnosyl/mannosyltransferase
MRVLHVYQAFHPARGGVEDFLLDLARESGRAYGDEHVVLTAGRPGRTETAEVDGVRVVRAATFGRYFTPLCPTWPMWVRRLRPDVVHAHVPCPMAELTVLTARVPRGRLAVTFHNDYVRPQPLVHLWRPIQARFLARAGGIVTSTASYAATSPALRQELDRVTTIPFGVAEVAPPAPQQIGRIRSRHGSPLIVFLGRLCYYKGVEVLIEAAGLMKQTGTVLIIGDGPWRDRLVDLAGDSAPVRFVGALPEAEALAHLQAADVFVLPSTFRSEAFGIAQLKAMACGVPVVSSDLPGVAWVNRHGETGLTVPPGDAPALAAALDLLLADDALRARLAAGARRHAKQFTLERMCAAYRSTYQDLLQHGVAHGREEV